MATEYVNTFDITTTMLMPGTYWLGLHQGPLSDSTGEGVNPVDWEPSLQRHGGSAMRDAAPFGDGFTPLSTLDLAFQLRGTVTMPDGGSSALSFSRWELQLSAFAADATRGQHATVADIPEQPESHRREGRFLLWAMDHHSVNA